MHHTFELQRLAITLIHFAWQGLAIALLTWALMTLNRRATIRYAIGCLGLLAMLAAPIVTCALLPSWTATEKPIPGSSAPAGPDVAAPAIPILTLSNSTARTQPTFIERVRVWLAIASPWIAAAWFSGIVLIGLRHVVGLAAIAGLRRRATTIIDADLQDRLARLAERMKLRQSIALLSSDGIESPCVIGWLRPAILWPAMLLPACAVTGLSPLQLNALLAHELAHIRRHDYVVNLLQACVETLGFYHPAVWWLSRRVRQEREHCCDDVAADVIGDRVGYAEALASAECLRQTLAFSLPVNGGSLMHRIRRLIAGPKPKRASIAGRLGATCILCVALLTGTRALRAQDATTKPTDDKTVQDYLIAPDDLLQIRVMELTAAGKESVFIKRVANSGIITAPYVDAIKVVGLSEAQAEAALRKAYREHHVLSDPVVSVLVVEGSDGKRVPAALLGPDSAESDDKSLKSPSTRISADADTAQLKAQVKALESALQMVDAASRGEKDYARTDKEHQVAQREPYFALLLKQRQLLQEDYEDLKAVQGPNAPDVVKARQDLDGRNNQIQSLAETLAKESRGDNPPSTNPLMRTNVFYIAGAVRRPGVYNLPKDRMDVGQALCSADAASLNKPVDVRIVRRWPDPNVENTFVVHVDLPAGIHGGALVPGDTLFVGAQQPTTSPTTAPTIAPTP